MRYRILSCLVISTLSSACAPMLPWPMKKSAPHAKSSPPAPAPKNGGGGGGGGGGEKSSPKCATRMDISLAQDRVVQRKTITVKMEKQRVIRKDCDGKVSSDSMEKVTYPNQEIELTPLKKWPGKSTTLPFNRTTCSGPGLELEAIFLKALFGIGLITDAADGVRNLMGFPRVRFSVDTSPTLSHMHVLKNADNYIDYEFQNCEQRNSVDGTCMKANSVEKGTLILTVNYNENLDIGGVKVIQDTSCNRAR
jgi:hypothetical protein